MPARESAVRREIKQKKGFRDRASEATVALLRTADVIRADLDRTLAESGVTAQQYNVLRILRGSHPERMATLEIAGRMIERTPGITRLLDRLEAAGHVHRERCREDRRRVLCRITEQGLATLAKTDAPVLATERKRTGRLSKTDLGALINLLDRLREEAT